jgi:hypothetical protein
VIPRLIRWYEERPVAGDTWLAGALLLVFVLPSELATTTDVVGGLAFSVALVACVPFRRRAPVAVFVVVSVLCLAQLAALDRIVAGDVVALIALYTLVAYGRGARVAAVGTVCTVAGALLAAARWDTSADGVATLEVAASTAGSALLAATLGAWRRSRRAQLAGLQERNRLLAIERDQQAAPGRTPIATSDGWKRGAGRRPSVA